MITTSLPSEAVDELPTNSAKLRVYLVKLWMNYLTNSTGIVYPPPRGSEFNNSVKRTFYQFVNI